VNAAMNAREHTQSFTVGNAMTPKYLWRHDIHAYTDGSNYSPRGDKTQVWILTSLNCEPAVVPTW